MRPSILLTILLTAGMAAWAQENPPREGDKPPGEKAPEGERPRGPGQREGGPREGGPREGGIREGGPREGGPRGEGGFREGGPREGMPRERRFDGPFPGGPGSAQGPMSSLIGQVDALRGWLDMIERYARMSRDPAAAGVAAVVGANDLLRSKPPQQAIEYFTKLLPEVKNESVQRAIRLTLNELYIKNNQPDQALEQMRTLMLAAPSMPAMTTSVRPEASGAH